VKGFSPYLRSSAQSNLVDAPPVLLMPKRMPRHSVDDAKTWSAWWPHA
jgi:hypothetical protein